MQVNKVKLSKPASDRLKQLKGRTGLTPNLLCRMGFCMSLNEPAIPDPDAYDHDGAEFNRYTLLGEFDPLFVALLKQRAASDGIPTEELGEQFRTHLNRGVMTINAHLKSLRDLPQLALASCEE